LILAAFGNPLGVHALSHDLVTPHYNVQTLSGDVQKDWVAADGLWQRPHEPSERSEARKLTQFVSTKSTTSEHDRGPLAHHMTLFAYTIMFVHYPGVCSSVLVAN